MWSERLEGEGGRRTAYGEPSGPSMMMFQVWMLASSARLTLIPAGGFSVTSPSSCCLLAKFPFFYFASLRRISERRVESSPLRFFSPSSCWRCCLWFVEAGGGVAVC